MRHEIEQAAAKTAKSAPAARQAQEMGLTIDDLTNEANTNRIETPSKLIKLPKVQRTRTKAYNSDGLTNLFAAMTPEE